MRTARGGRRGAGPAPTSRAGTGTNSAFEGGAVIGFKGVQAGVEQLALWNDDDVESGSEFVATENLSNQSLGSITHDGAAELSGRRDSQPAYARLIGEEEQRAVSAVYAV